MTGIWAYSLQPSGKPGPDYWNYFAQRMVELARIPEGAVILDVGTDNGNVLFKAMEKAGHGGFGVGIDIDYRGLKEGLPELKNHWSKDVIFAQMDAGSLGFLSDTFAFVLADFVGWDYCYDFARQKFTAPDYRMREIVRVLKPGGQVGIGSWTEQSDIDWYARAVQRHFPECLESTGEDFSAYSKENVEGYQVILRSSGLENILVRLVTEAFVLPDEESWWRQMSYAAREYFKLIADSPDLEGFKEKVFAELQQFRTAAGIQFDKTVAFVFGMKA